MSFIFPYLYDRSMARFEKAWLKSWRQELLKHAYGEVVEDQSERGQALVDTGLYASVRHPWYLGLLPLMAGIALWLESYAGTIAVSVLLAVSIARIVAEETTLQKTLPGYSEYMKKVRYRLVPFIW